MTTTSRRGVVRRRRPNRRPLDVARVSGTVHRDTPLRGEWW